VNFLEFIFIVLGISLVVAVIYYAKDVFIKTPLLILDVILERTLFVISVLTLPVWLPLFYLSDKYNWGLEQHAIVKFFTKSNRLGVDEDDNDFEYESESLIKIDPAKTEFYLFSSNKDSKKIEAKIIEGISLNPTSKLTCTQESTLSKTRTVFKLNNASLYDFHFLIQWLDEEFKRSKNYGVAATQGFSFYSYQDAKSLNNLLGKTDDGKKFSYSLTGGNLDALSINSKLDIKEIKDIELLNNISEFASG